MRDRNQNPFKTGDILCSVWGYSMTIVDFYQVVDVTPSGVYIQPIGQETKGTGYLSGYATPTPNEFDTNHAFVKGKVFRRVLDGKRINITPTTQRAVLWDGTPKYYDHCD